MEADKNWSVTQTEVISREEPTHREAPLPIPEGKGARQWGELQGNDRDGWTHDRSR